MPHVPPLVSTIAIGFVLAFAFGVAAQRLKLPPLVGYLLAGIAVGPVHPGTRSPTRTSPISWPRSASFC